jgi:nucleoside-diphosphate-sugar epimerase
MKSMSKTTLQRIWELSPNVQNHDAYVELTQLTKELIKTYEEQGRLSGDPFSPTREREISVPVEKIRKELNNSICVVTGGMGCVGSILVIELLKLGVAKIVILDNSKMPFLNSERVVRFNCDIRNLALVQEIFSLYRPHFVFHAAAQRDPGLAETHVVETVSTNVTGTRNIIKASEAIGSVRQLVSSSTGKASRYFTKEIYAGSKKMNEFMLDAYARTSHIKYSMIRCTHILDNSLMNIELHRASRNKDQLVLHSPGKYVTAQNGNEAVSLMLNALIYSKERECRFLLVRHLAWPVESLQMALYYIRLSGRDIPVVFAGNPPGYSEKFFRGQMDWSKPDDLNLLINVYEKKHRTLNPAGDIIISRPCATSKVTLDEVLDEIENVRGETETKAVLIDGLREIVRESLKNVNKQETVDILRWGLEPKVLETENMTAEDFRCLISLLTESLEGTKYHKVAEDLIYQNV